MQISQPCSRLQGTAMSVQVQSSNHNTLWEIPHGIVKTSSFKAHVCCTCWSCERVTKIEENRQILLELQVLSSTPAALSRHFPRVILFTIAEKARGAELFCSFFDLCSALNKTSFCYNILLIASLPRPSSPASPFTTSFCSIYLLYYSDLPGSSLEGCRRNHSENAEVTE
jgi:hypothetical protein